MMVMMVSGNNEEMQEDNDRRFEKCIGIRRYG